MLLVEISGHFSGNVIDFLLEYFLGVGAGVLASLNDVNDGDDIRLNTGTGAGNGVRIHNLGPRHLGGGGGGGGGSHSDFFLVKSVL